jgi:hypothetical protein
MAGLFDWIYRGVSVGPVAVEEKQNAITLAQIMQDI